MRQHFYYTRGVSVEHNVMLAAHIAASVVYGSSKERGMKMGRNGNGGH